MTREEIKDCLSKIIYDEKDYGGRSLLKDNGTAWVAYYKMLKNSELWLEYLLSECERLEAKVKQLEFLIKTQTD